MSMDNAKASNEQSLSGSDVSFKVDGNGDSITNSANSPTAGGVQGLGGETNLCVQFLFYKKSGSGNSNDSLLDTGDKMVAI